MRGVRVYTWSPMEMKAFGTAQYEIMKKVKGGGGNLKSAWFSFWPAMIGTYALIKWAEGVYHKEQLSHRD